jgi:putative hemolysin
MWTELFVLFALILLNGFFSMAEMSVVSSRKARLRNEAEKGRKNYRLALETAESPSRFLSTIQVAITLIGILTGALGGATLAQALQAAFSKLHFLAPIANPLALGLVVIATTFVSVVFGELVPKAIALGRPEAIAARIIRPVRALSFLFAPITRMLSWSTDRVISLLGRSGEKEPSVTEDEVKILIAQGAKAGVFDDREREMVEGVLSLGDRRVTSLMIPRPEVVFLDLDEGSEAARATILANSRYGYLPAVEGDLDRVVGMLPTKEALAAIVGGSFKDPRAFLEKPVLVPESLTALKAFSAIKNGSVKTALIIDEYGGVSGLVALADLMESIVGELPLTGDAEEPGMVRREDGSWLVDGALSVEEFLAALDIGEQPDEGDYETVAGLVLDRMGSIPRAGDTCRWDGLRFEVMDMDGNRIDKLLVTQVPEEKAPIEQMEEEDRE